MTNLKIFEMNYIIQVVKTIYDIYKIQKQGISNDLSCTWFWGVGPEATLDNLHEQLDVLSTLTPNLTIRGYEYNLVYPNITKSRKEHLEFVI